MAEATYFSVGLATVMCFLALYGMIAAIIALQRLSIAAQDWNNVIYHWEALPIMDFQLVDSNLNCPTGYVEGTSNQDLTAYERIGKWDGSRAWCECHDTGYQWTYTYTEFRCCPSSGSCNTQWGSGACNGTTGTQSRDRQKTDTHLTSEGYCSWNATQAGCVNDTSLNAVELDKFDGKRLCILRGGTAAIDRPVLERGATSCPDGYYKCGSGDYDTEGTVCAKTQAECPITSFGNFNGSMNNFTRVDGVGGRPIIEVWITMSTPCFKGSEGVNGRSYNARVKDPQNQGCESDDPRFLFWHDEPESELYSANGVPSGGQNTGPPAAYAPATTTSGASVSANAYTSPSQDYTNTDTSVNWRISYRPEIYWASDCELGNMEAINNYEGPIRKVKAIQTVLLACCIIFGFCLSWFMCCVESYDMYDGTDKVSSMKQSAPYIGLGCAWLSHLAKLIPLIMCFVQVSRVIGWFEDAQGTECSDPTTNGVIQEASDQLIGVYNANIQNLISEILMVIVHIFQVIGTFCVAEGMIKDYCSVIVEDKEVDNGGAEMAGEDVAEE